MSKTSSPSQSQKPMDLAHEVELTLSALGRVLRKRLTIDPNDQAAKLDADIQLFNVKVQLDRVSLRLSELLDEVGISVPRPGAVVYRPRETQQ